MPPCETSTPPHDVLTHCPWQPISATHLALLGALGNALDRVLDNIIEAPFPHKRWSFKVPPNPICDFMTFSLLLKQTAVPKWNLLVNFSGLSTRSYETEFNCMMKLSMAFNAMKTENMHCNYFLSPCVNPK